MDGLACDFDRLADAADGAAQTPDVPTVHREQTELA
jgi:hypothetical protein